MPKNLLFISIVFFLTLITSHKRAAKPVHQSKKTLETKYLIAATVKSKLDAFKYLSKYGYNPCQNQTGFETNNIKSDLCQGDIESMLKDFQSKYKLPVTGKLDQETLKLINTPRCAIKD